MGLKNSHNGHIFHLTAHGDHCFGLMGLISTFECSTTLLTFNSRSPRPGETHAEPPAEYFCEGLPFRVLSAFNPSVNEIIYEDQTIQVSSILLQTPGTVQWLSFEEKTGDRYIIRDMIDFLPRFRSGKSGKLNWVKILQPKKAEIISMTCWPCLPLLPSVMPTASDTAYSEKIMIIEGVDMLYHEATFYGRWIIPRQEPLSLHRPAGSRNSKKPNVKDWLSDIIPLFIIYKTALLNGSTAGFWKRLLGKIWLLWFWDWISKDYKYLERWNRLLATEWRKYL